jgi:hypothetical protein
VPDDISFVWPATGPIQVIPLPGGGCNIKITFAERGIVRSIGRGRILKVRNIPTKRIAQQYEILVRHEGDFESSYGIVDLTPHLPAGEVRCLMSEATLVEDGCELYNIRHGGILHFQLFRAGKPLDPREYIHEKIDGAIEATRQPTDIRR